MIRPLRYFPAVLIAVLLLLMPAVPVSATTYSYTNATLLSSLEFQAAINATKDGDTIALAPGIYWINKTLLVFNDTTIQSNGGTAQNTILDGVTPWGQSPSDGIFSGSYDVNLNKKTFTLKDLTLRNSQSTNAQGGGGVNVYGNITVISSEFFNVSTDSNRKGGALAVVSGNGANITVIGSKFTWCSARQGGAIYSQNSFVIVNSSSFVSCSAGIATGGGAIYSNGGGNFTFNRFDNVTAPDGNIIRNNGGGGDIAAIEDWWGTNNPAASLFSGTVIYNPYLKMGLIASPSTVTTAQTSTITANLTYDSAGTQPSPNLLPDSIPVFFTIGSGPGSIPAAPVLTAGHAASATLTPSGAGTVQVNASTSVYNESVLVTVSAAPVTATPTATPVPTTTGGGGGGGGNWYEHPGKPSSVIQQHIDQPVAKPPVQQPGAFDTTVIPTQTPVPAMTAAAPVLHPPTILDMILPAIQEYQFWLILIIILIILIAILRRWWIRRQNPSLFRKYD